MVLSVPSGADQVHGGRDAACNHDRVSSKEAITAHAPLVPSAYSFGTSRRACSSECPTVQACVRAGGWAAQASPDNPFSGLNRTALGQLHIYVYFLYVLTSNFMLCCIAAIRQMVVRAAQGHILRCGVSNIFPHPALASPSSQFCEGELGRHDLVTASVPSVELTSWYLERDGAARPDAICFLWECIHAP